MPKQCDHKSVGMLVWQDDKLLLVERMKPPFGFAPPAGHVEGNDSFEDTARRELEEETGLKANDIEFLIEGRKDNNYCRRGGTWHYWKIYKIEAEGEIKRSEDETRQAGFYSKSDIALLAAKTEKYLQGDIKEDEWEKSPGLETVWYEWLKKLRII